MKNLLKYILSLVILFGVVPVNGQEAIVVETPQTCSITKECCQIVSSEDVKKKKKKKGKKLKGDKGKKKKKGFFSKVFGSK